MPIVMLLEYALSNQISWDDAYVFSGVGLEIRNLGQNFFISRFTNPPTVIFRKVEKKIKFNF